MSKESQQKIDSLNILIKEKEDDQKKLNEEIINFKNDINVIDNHINKIKNQKVIIKEYYHEKINNVDTFSDDNVNSFFTERYNGNQ